MVTIRELRTLAQAGKLSILAGAGISADPPSKLPLAKQFVWRAVSAIADSVDTDFKDALLDAGMSLRPEVFMGVLVEHCGSKALGFAHALLFADPNENHYRIAKCINAGALVATTNFDLLIEQAALQNGYPSPSLGVPPYYVRPSAESGGGLYKLHGTLSLQMAQTISGLAVSYRQTSARRTRYLRSALRHVLEERPVLLVIGYAGLDDFDINPLLRTMRCEDVRAVWINHAEGEIPAIDDDLRTASAPLPNEGAAGLFKAGVYLNCPTAAFLGQVVPDEFHTENTRLHSNEQEQLKVWANWARSLKTPPKILLGAIAHASNRQALAVSLLQSSLRLDRLSQHARVRAQLLLAAALRRQGNVGEALVEANVAFNAAQKLGSALLTADSLHAIGSHKRVMSDWRAAAHAYLRGARLLRRHKKAGLRMAELINSLAIALDKLGKTQTAVRLVEGLLTPIERRGELEVLSRFHNNLALMHQNLGATEIALHHLAASIALKRTLGDVYGLGNGLHNLGWLHEKAGASTLALSAYSESLQAKKRSGAAGHGIAQTYSSIAQVLVSKRIVGRARRCARKAIPALILANDRFGAAEAFWAMAETYALSGDPVRMRHWLDAARRHLDDLASTREVSLLRSRIEQTASDVRAPRRAGCSGKVS
jgi:tetratricopeptide (TPR) repeat protein